MKNLVLILMLAILGSFGSAQAQFKKKDSEKDLMSVKLKEKNNKNSRQLRNDPRVKTLKKKDRVGKATNKRLEKRKKRNEKVVRKQTGNNGYSRSGKMKKYTNS